MFAQRRAAEWPVLLDAVSDVDRDKILAVSAQLSELNKVRLGQLQLMDPFGRGNPEFWLLYDRAGLGLPAGLWQRQVRLMAWLTNWTQPERASVGPHNPFRSLGTVLRKTGYPEGRLLRLLSCPAADRWEHLDHLSRWLGPRWDGQGVDCLALWQLQHSFGRAVERQIAGDYFGAQVARKERSILAFPKRGLIEAISRKLGF
jgi:hypothetical protein